MHWHETLSKDHKSDLFLATLSASQVLPGCRIFSSY